MTRWIKALFYLPFFLLTQLVHGQNLYDAAHTEKYARHLFYVKDYAAAAIEYKRLATLKPRPDSARLRALVSYRLGGEYDSAAIYFAKTYPIAPLAPAGITAEYCRSLILWGKYNDLGILLHGPFRLDSANYMKFRFYKQVLSHNQAIDSSLVQVRPWLPDTLFDKWKLLAHDEQHLHYKSPALSTTLSLVPGLGKIYTGDWKDGIVSAVIIGSMGYESYVGFHTRGTRSVFGWIFGGLTVGFYGGNLYGSYKAAVRYNTRLNNNIHDEAERLVISDF